ncbi:MAG TPA: efflux RND transporter permease subunit [Candidatus Aquilonibacter sp.]
MWLTRFSIQRPIIVAMLFIALAIYGAFSFFQIGRSLNPNVTFPIVVVAATYPGASPAEMERLVIKPIEDQIDGIDNLDQMSATAEEGRADVVVQFKLDTNLDYAAIDVQRRVDTARVYMPTDLDPPLVDKSAGSQQAPILTLALSSHTLSATALSDLVAQRIVPDIRHVPNIQSVDTSGDVKREFHVLPDPLRLMGTGATVSDIFQAINANNATVPGGRLEAPNSETDVSVHSDIVRASDMLGIPLPIASALLANGIAPAAANGLRIGDVATVDDGHVEQRIVSKFNGAPTVVLDVNRVITSDEIKSTEVLRDQLKTIEARYPMVHFEEVAAAADYTQKSLDGVLQSLVEGIVLTAVVLMLFLHAWRNALVVMISIPSSLLSTFIVMKQLHFTLDIVSLMGVSLIIGILVDDSIVVLENITRHRDLGQSPVDAAISGRSEIGGAAVAITLVDVVVFLPIAFLSGIVGKYMIEFGIVVVVATLFSLLVSFTLTPMLAARWSIVKRSAEPPRSLAWFQTGFERFTAWYRDRALRYALSHRWLTVGVCVVLLASALALPVAGLVQSEFVPNSNTGSISMTLTYHAGTPLAKTVVAVDRLDAAIQKLPYVHATLSTVGKKPAGWDQTTGGFVAKMTVELDKNHRAATNDVVRQIRTLAYLVPGGVLTVAGEGGNGVDPIFYTLSGPEDEIQAGADKLAAVIRAIPGTVNVQTGMESETNRLNIDIDRAKCALLGVSPGAAATAARVAIGGAVATRVRTDSGLVDVRVQLPAEYRNRLADVEKIRVRANDGISLYRLSDLASFSFAPAPTKIERLDKQRIVRVTGGFDPGLTTLGTVTQKMNAAVNQPGFFPSGVALRASGDSQYFAETFSSMGVAMLTSFALVYVLMVILYSSFLTPFVIMFSVPLALVGALYALALTHQTLNLFSLIGIIMLFGLVAKNGILLVDYANTQRHRGLRVVEAMRTAAGIRLRPIVMTTASMVFGMLPLALGLAEGAEFRRSMGTVLIGGLLSSLILTLFLVPVVYAWVAGAIEKRADRQALVAEHSTGEERLFAPQSSRE